MTHARAEQYRRLAEECLAAMRTVSTEETRGVLIERAQYWFQLAKEQDDQSADFGGSIPPTPTPKSHPQQQVKPKDDDKKE